MTICAMKRTSLFILAALLCIVAAARAEPAYENPFPEWQIRRWAGRSFVFLSYGGAWDQAYQRFAIECKAQRLLTPTWEDPAFPHPVESAATEWGYGEQTQGRTRRECYEWMKQLYLGKIASAVKGGKPFYSLTGHGFYSVYGAQWGCDMLGLETGENIIAMQAQLAFLRGAARQNSKPFYVQPSQWFGGTTPLFKEGVAETVAHPFNEEAVRQAISKGGIAMLNGGHSSSLLARMWYVAWLSGAAVVCPEACQANFFCGTEAANAQFPPDQRIPLSPIGKRAQELMAFVEKVADRGIPYTPFALLLDQYGGFNGFQLTQPRPWNVLTPTLADREVSLFLDTIFPKSMWLDVVPGVNDDEQERWRLVRSPYGDSFDVLLSNARQELLNCYPVVICLGEHEFLPETVARLHHYLEAGGRLFLTHAQAEQLGERLVSLRRAGRVELFGLTKSEIPSHIDAERWYTPPHWGASATTLTARKTGVQLLPYEKRFVAEVTRLMNGLRDEYVPVRVTGDVEFTVNWRPTGWLVGIINNEGVTKGNLTPVKVDAAKKQTVTIELLKSVAGVVKRSRGQRTPVHLTRAEDLRHAINLPVKDNKVSLEIPPGEVQIIELRE